MIDYSVLIEDLHGRRDVLSTTALDCIVQLQARVAELEAAWQGGLVTIVTERNEHRKRAERAEADLAAARALLRSYPGDSAGLHLLGWEQRRKAMLDGRTPWDWENSCKRAEADLAAARALLMDAAELLDEVQSYTSHAAHSPSMTRDCAVAVGRIRLALAGKDAP